MVELKTEAEIEAMAAAGAVVAEALRAVQASSPTDADPLPEFTHHIDKQLDIPLRGAPIDDRRTQRHMIPVHRRAGVDPAVGQQLPAQPRVQLIEPLLGNTWRPVAKTGDAQLNRGQTVLG